MSQTITTIRITNYKTAQHHDMGHTVDNSDTESFHSAITSITKGSRCRSGSKSHKRRSYSIPEEHGAETIRTRSRKNSLESNPNHPDDGHSSSRPRSRRSPKSSVTIPRRRSSLPARSSRKPDLATFHRQSCQLFSSLDGMLALSREFTPLPSVSSSRPTTRHASIIPETMQQICGTIDAKLAVMHTHYTYTQSYSYSYSLPSDSASSIPLDICPSTCNSDEATPRISSSSGCRHDQHQSRPRFNTVMSWTSDESRRKEYEKIDRANSGVRGFMRQVLPRCLQAKSLRARRGFFTGECDGDSVRRFRLDVPEEEEEAGDAENVSRAREPGRERQNRGERGNGEKNRFLCFR